MSLCIVYLASPRNTRIYGSDSILRLQCLNTSINITRKVFPNTDIIVFHEDLIETDVPSYVNLQQIDFKGQEEYHNKDIKYRPYGYLMMCRFFSGIMQNHPVLEKYTHYMRLDDDSYFMNDCSSISIDEMLEYDYVYRVGFTEESVDQTKLYEYTRNFLSNRNLTMPNFNKQFAPYNNFHISSIRLWKDPLVKEYIDELESKHLILTEHVFDANVHANIIWGLVPHTILRVKQFINFGYRHNYHTCFKNTNGITLLENIPFCPESYELETYDIPKDSKLNSKNSNLVKQITYPRNNKFIWNKV
jgi:hypothetical protein